MTCIEHIHSPFCRQVMEHNAWYYLWSDSHSIAFKRACQVLIETDLLTSSKINCPLVSVIASARKDAVNEMRH